MNRPELIRPLFGNGREIRKCQVLPGWPGRSTFYHAVEYCINRLYRTGTHCDKNVIIHKLRLGLAREWTNQDKYGGLLHKTGSYDDFLLHITNSTEASTAADVVFTSHVLRINIISVDLKTKRIIWPETDFCEYIIVTWSNGVCFPLSVNDKLILDKSHFDR